MTRWNASVSTSTLLHLIFTLAAPNLAAAFRFQARHHGKSHQNHIHRHIDARQDAANGPFVGIGMILSPSVTVLPAVSRVTPACLPPDEPLETISAIDAAFGGAAAPSMRSMVTASSSSEQTTITSFAPPVFPITVIQVPIYTICPDPPGYINTTSTLSSNKTALYSNATATGNATYLPQIVSAIPISVNATALLSNGSYTTFLSQSLSSPSITPTSVPNARIILGTNGCQTLYSASITQICSTIITRGGQLPITVTNCSQLVTFSSSSASVAPVCNCPTASACPTAPTSPASQTVSGMLTSETISSALGSGEGRNTGFGIAFFAAPWHEIAAGIVPGLVHVVDCADERAFNCSTSRERWSVNTSTSIATSTRTVQYAGVSLLFLVWLEVPANETPSPQSLPRAQVQ
jgi:hypothetical protein